MKNEVTAKLTISMADGLVTVHAEMPDDENSLPHLLAQLAIGHINKAMDEIGSGHCVTKGDALWKS